MAVCVGACVWRGGVVVADDGGVCVGGGVGVGG